MSPEQARGEELDARTDLFSFGAVLYEMATGQMTFSGNTQAMIHEAILSRTPQRVRKLTPDAPPALEGAIGKALEKDREKRWQSAGELQAALVRAQKELRARRWRKVKLAAAPLMAAAALLVWFLRPAPAPRALRTLQLTHFGRADGAVLASDGRELYFGERTGGTRGIARVPVDGGEATLIATPFPNTTLYDISPDGSELLVGGGRSEEDESPLWALPMSGGAPRRLGNAIGHDAAWSRDGQRMVYVSGFDLYLAKPDGSESRKLVTVDGWPHSPRWSPDGRVLRFALEEPATHYYSLWEVSGDGRNLHRLLAPWRGIPLAAAESGDWTPDGKYFVFRAAGANTASVWAIREGGGALHRPPSAPMLLTTTDLSLWSLLAARDGKRIFLEEVRSHSDRELQGYDSRLKQFVPYLGGVPARWVSFSPDGQWVGYYKDVKTSAAGLWRSRLDGSERLQLTFPPMVAWQSRWSPDGKLIAFAGAYGVDYRRIYLVPSDGGKPEPVTPERYRADDPEWSPDGSALLFSVRTPGGTTGSWNICRLDLKTRHITQLPGSQGLRAPAYSPDGKYVAAIAWGSGRMALFDVHSQRWTRLTKGNLANTSTWSYWSRDSKYVYGQELADSADEPVFRVRISDRKVEVVATRKQFTRADVKAFSLTGLTPDGSPLVSLMRSEDEIYALDVDFP